MMMWQKGQGHITRIQNEGVYIQRKNKMEYKYDFKIARRQIF